jgi:ascorbate-specific PTS system EIIC-type component UlaA
MESVLKMFILVGAKNFRPVVMGSIHVSFFFKISNYILYKHVTSVRSLTNFSLGHFLP